MTARQKRKIETLITHKQAAAQQRYLARCARLVDLSIKDVGDLADEAKKNQTLSLHIALEEHDLDELRGIQEARGRLTRKDFGRCQDCGERIEVPRLLVLPEAALCYACAAERDQQKGRQSYSQGGF